MSLIFIFYLDALFLFWNESANFLFWICKQASSNESVCKHHQQLSFLSFACDSLVAICFYPTSPPLANAAPIARQSLGTKSILKLKYFRISLYSIISLIFFMFYDIKKMKLSVVIYPYPTFSLANAIASPIGSQSPGNSFILKLKYCSRLSLYISPLQRTA